MPQKIIKKCFVCSREIEQNEITINKLVNLPVCSFCSCTDREKKKVEELLDSLAEGLACGCI